MTTPLTDNTTDGATNSAPDHATDGAFAPLRQRLFAMLWTATVVGNIGSFMRDIASGWVVTDLTANAAAVAAVQAAATLPVCLFAIPAGVLSDILDRRRFLIGVQLMLALVSAGLMLLAALGALSVGSLVALTFLGGVGAALMGPTWQSIVPELVPRPQLRSAVALNSLGVNIARAIGPALGGLLLAAFGAVFTYGVDLISYAFVIAALWAWRRPARQHDPLSEHFLGAFRAGLRYARASRELHVVLLRAGVFFGVASAVWALLPLVTRQLLGGSAGFYGLMLGAVGLGAIGGALWLPRLRPRLGADGLMLGSALLSAAVMAALAVGLPRPLALAAMLVLGLAWIVALTTLSGITQAILPNWVRGRGLAVYLTVFNGAMALGSLAWGALATGVGLPAALGIAAAAMALAGLWLRRTPLPAGEANLDAARHWPEPAAHAAVTHDRGPVLVQVQYRIRAADRSAFLAAMQDVALERRRDGAYAWGVSEHSADPEHIIEWFFVESWAEHLRQHQRVSHADADQQAAAQRFHTGDAPPVVHHYLGLG